MDPALLSAIAATSAAIFSIANIAFTTRLSHKQDSQKWTRELLPDVVVAIEKAFHEQYMALFETDRSEMSFPEKEQVGIPEFRNVLALFERLSVFASPQTIWAAREVQLALEDMRLVLIDGKKPESGPSMKWATYRKYGRANDVFLEAARHEMGLASLARPAPSRPLRKLKRRLESKQRRHLKARHSNQ